jgi:hypothetical protein
MNNEKTEAELSQHRRSCAAGLNETESPWRFIFRRIFRPVSERRIQLQVSPGRLHCCILLLQIHGQNTYRRQSVLNLLERGEHCLPVVCSGLRQPDSNASVTERLSKA